VFSDVSLTPYFNHFSTSDHGAALKIERKTSQLNIAFDRYASIDTIMHYILVISTRYNVKKRLFIKMIHSIIS